MRLIDIEKPYEIWDEITSYTVGLQYFYNVANLDFNADSWKISPHPPIARYFFGAVNGYYIFSKVGTELFTLDKTDAVRILYELKNFVPGRMLSAVLGSLTVVIVFLVALKFTDKKTAILAALILSFSPAFLAYSRLAQPDSITIFFYTLSVSLFMLAVKKNKYKYYALAAISTGLSLGSKLSALSLLILLPLIYLVYHKDLVAHFKKTSVLKLASLPLITLFTFYITWPRIWTNTIDNFLETVELQSFVSTMPEYFLGSFEHPFYYYITYFAAATPAGLLLLLIPAGVYISRKKNNFHTTVILWLAVHLLVFSFSILKQTGIKNTLVAYPAFAILASIGVLYLSEKLRPYIKGKSFSFIGGIVILYLLYTAYSIHPYYLDYYNEFVGGPNNVYENRLFTLGWLGEGISEAAEYLSKNANGTVQFYVVPRHVIPPHDLKEINKYVPDYLIENGIVKNTTDNNIWIMKDVKPVADFLVENTNYRWYIDPDFSQSISKNYKLIHTVETHGAPLVWIYSKV